MNLKSQLFPDPNNTGKKTTSGEPIMVGDVVEDQNGVKMRVFINGSVYHVGAYGEVPYESLPLNLFISMSETIEIFKEK